MSAALSDGALTFTLPPELEAREPAEERGLPRDGVRMLVSDRATGRTVHATFRDLPRLLHAGDLLVVNDSATLPAALDARGEDGRALALHLSTQIAGTLWVVEPRGAVGDSETLRLPADGSATLVLPVRTDSTRLWFARVDVDETIVEYLHLHGRPIRYPYVKRDYPIGRYQTIFARVPGSAEMASAGRPFSRAMLRALVERDVRLATLTLHAGVSSLEAHEAPYAEPFTVSPATARAVNVARREGRRIIAVGTTVVRALESALRNGEVLASQGWTDLVVTRERGLALVDGLLTGFHEPRASHLQMLSAFLGSDGLRDTYREALAARYFWHEFGDVHLIV